MTEQQVVDRWNRDHPIGTAVRYWPGARRGDGLVSRTRTNAQLLGESAVVWVVGEAACIALTHVEACRATPLDELQPLPRVTSLDDLLREAARQGACVVHLQVRAGPEGMRLHIPDLAAAAQAALAGADLQRQEDAEAFTLRQVSEQLGRRPGETLLDAAKRVCEVRDEAQEEIAILREGIGEVRRILGAHSSTVLTAVASRVVEDRDKAQKDLATLREGIEQLRARLGGGR